MRNAFSKEGMRNAFYKEDIRNAFSKEGMRNAFYEEDMRNAFSKEDMQNEYICKNISSMHGGCRTFTISVCLVAGVSFYCILVRELNDLYLDNLRCTLSNFSGPTARIALVLAVPYLV
jgi:hypothetical protein